MILTSSLTHARPIISVGGGSKGREDGKYSSRNSRMEMDCRIIIGLEKVEEVTVRVGTLADGLSDVYVGEV